MTRLAVAAVAACIVFEGVYGFAASVGMNTNGLGATSKMVASCGSGMTLLYTTTFDPEISGQAVNGIDLSNIPVGCLNKTLSVTFYDDHNDAVGSAVDAALPASGATQSLSIAPGANAIDAGRVSGVSIVVS